MIVEIIECKTVNAIVYIHDDSAKPFTPEGKAEIERRCSEIVYAARVRDMAKKELAEKNKSMDTA